MKSLKEIVCEKKIRRGTAEGTTKRGAYWVLTRGRHFAQLRRAGGDGIGQSAPDITYYLDLRHYRSGEIRAVVRCDAWHQNGSYSGGGVLTQDASAILDCRTIEEVVVALKAMSMDGASIYSERGDLVASLIALGLPMSEPAPDDVVRS